MRGERIVLCGKGIVCGRSLGRWGIVEMDVEEQVMVVVRVSFLEFPSNRAVRRANVVAHNLSEHIMHVRDLS